MTFKKSSQILTYHAADTVNIDDIIDYIFNTYENGMNDDDDDDDDSQISGNTNTNIFESIDIQYILAAIKS